MAEGTIGCEVAEIAGERRAGLRKRQEMASGQEANLQKTPPQSLRDDHHEVVHAAFSSSVPKRTKSIGPYLIHAERLLRAKKHQKNSRATLEDICELACETKYPGPATEQWELLGGSILPDISWPPMGTPSKRGASDDTDSMKQNSDSNSCGNNDITKDSETMCTAVKVPRMTGPRSWKTKRQQVKEAVVLPEQMRMRLQLSRSSMRSEIATMRKSSIQLKDRLLQVLENEIRECDDEE